MIDISDVILLCRYAAEDKEAVVSQTGLINADVNGDGKRNAADASMILKCVAKLLEETDLNPNR